MTDSHVHIGQYDDAYYDPLEVADIVMSAPGMEGFAFSSTTSCAEDVAYIRVEHEIAGFLSAMPYPPEKARPFFWCLPDYIRQGVHIENAAGAIPYRGIKLHPYAQQWDIENLIHMDALQRLFDYADRHALPVLIHTGHSGVDSADRFEDFFFEFQNTEFILAHCRPLETAAKMLKTSPNVSGDTAFMPESDLRYLTEHGLGNKLVFGTDFPITRYFKTRFPESGADTAITLREQYAEDLRTQGIRENRK
jgi:predicted TIM-barrel fold metal-dependent hydrolase